MAWTTPLTAATGGLSAAQYNSSVRDNLIASETAGAFRAKFVNGTPIKDVNGIASYTIATGTTAVAARYMASDTFSDAQSTTSTSYVALDNNQPSVTIQTGTQALCWYSCGMNNTTGTSNAFASIAISGATTLAASDNYFLSVDGMSNGDATNNFHSRQSTHLFTGLTAGLNSFTMQYRVSGATGWFRYRQVVVMPL